MNEETIRIIIEIVGYLGMGFVIISFAMKNIRLLRILNIIGAVLCCTYGFITKTYPTALLNLALIIVNLIFPIRYFINNVVRKQKKEDN